MKAIGIRAYGGLEALSFLDVPDPQPGPRDLVVRVRAAGVNPVDGKVRSGLRRAAPLGAPLVLGWDGSGVVEHAGAECTRFRPGDEVYFAGDIGRPGCHAERVAVDERIVGRKPRKLTHAHAAALPLTLLTAWEAFVETMGAPADGSARGAAALVVGGGGGVGSIAIQVAKRVCGLRVVATASRAESRAFCTKMGAEAVLDHTEDLKAQTDALGLAGYDFILDTAEPGNLPALARVLNPFGRICCILPAEGELDLAELFAKRATLGFEMMFARTRFGVEPERQGRILDDAAALLDQGVLRTTLTRTLDWGHFVEAHRQIETGHTVGKIVLEIGA
jgi:zinc-binding alcohol dehydrogenase family protein